ncbi:peroxisomal 2,4-dienoyl-CoA reductase [(3E)-enoyl-CoA-producing] isoform X2 [Gadus morhua]|uniref:peroxisomal 2,4-dienoyl-CoA reductase [(3E)-enoyl-CoA-producing] isoform X2 n=1 Tax=Gadus morhua TaxID=8049 RepID=UPI0011B66ED6|nr:peroxisomal 2,4-dienoyl-CoA reductase isoform X2 [Gadus morhua]
MAAVVLDDTSEVEPTAPLPVNEGFTKEQTLFLIQQIRLELGGEGPATATSFDDLNRRLRSGKKSKKVLWEEMAAKLAGQFGEHFLQEKVCRKWLTLTEGYKKVKENTALTGRGPVRFQFYKEMDEMVVWCDSPPSPAPVDTAPSPAPCPSAGLWGPLSGAPSPAQPASAFPPSPASSAASPPPVPAPSRPVDSSRLRKRKRKADPEDTREDELLAYLESSDGAAMAASQKRHEECLSEMKALREDRRELLQLFGRMVDKIKLKKMSKTQRVGERLPEDVGTDDCMDSYTYTYSPDLLKDQVAFITGGGSGIGFRIAEVFMRHGCDTVIASRNLDKLKEAANKLSTATGRRCLPLHIDVRNPETITAAVEETLKELGHINILINNAAGNFLCPASALSFNAFKTVMEIDTMGTFNASKVIYEKWFKDHGGNIVNISATLGYRGQGLQVHAGSAKAANDAMTKHLAVEWGPSGVRVNTLAPGPISGTEGYRRLGGPQGEARGAFSSIPLQRAGNKTEMAHGVLFLASRVSSYMTGAALVMDGGAWLTSANDVAAMLGIASNSAKL